MRAPNKLVATGHGGPSQRVRLAIEQALPELRLDTSGHARLAIERAGLAHRVREHDRDVSLLLDRIASAIVDESRPYIATVASIHSAANAHERERLARTPRVPGTFAGVAP